jgi:nucleotidyltransferase/DNA polymerase involved in DNA repair
MIAQTVTAPDTRAVQDFARELAGVPKPVLRTVFGKHLGRRIWELTRRPCAEQTRSGLATSDQTATTHTASDAARAKNATRPTKMATDLIETQILDGMLGYLSRQASDTLSRNRRMAQSVTVTLGFEDGSCQIASDRLARPTNDAKEICHAVTDLFRRLSAAEGVLASINLTAKSVEADADVEIAPDLGCALAGVSS